MGLMWFRIKAVFTGFKLRNAKLFRKLYWSGLVLGVSLIFIIPIGMTIRNPNVRLPDFHGGPPVEMTREWTRLMNQTRREQGRVNDFVLMINQLTIHYPFLEQWEAHMELANDLFFDLLEVARYETAADFFSDFLNENFLSQLGGYGQPRVTAQWGEAVDWLEQPYFFGLYDWRFYDERFEVDTLEGNVTTEILDDSTARVRINAFLPKGYEEITRHPVWNFNFDEDEAKLMNFYAQVHDFDKLIIDIRGIGSGFGDYFVPLVLAPHLTAPVTGQFYAFHTRGGISANVSRAYREWYGFAQDVYDSALLSAGFAYEIPDMLTRGFAMHRVIEPAGDAAFGGQIWLITDSENFTGPNFMYLQMARDAGFVIVYEETEEVIGWETSFVRLPSTRLVLRFNPLFFTDALGRSLEVAGAFYDYRLGAEGVREVLLLQYLPAS